MMKMCLYEYDVCVIELCVYDYVRNVGVAAFPHCDHSDSMGEERIVFSLRFFGATCLE